MWSGRGGLMVGDGCYKLHLHLTVFISSGEEEGNWIVGTDVTISPSFEKCGHDHALLIWLLRF